MVFWTVGVGSLVAYREHALKDCITTTRSGVSTGWGNPKFRITDGDDSSNDGSLTFLLTAQTPLQAFIATS